MLCYDSRADDVCNAAGTAQRPVLCYDSRADNVVCNAAGTAQRLVFTSRRGAGDGGPGSDNARQVEQDAGQSRTAHAGNMARVLAL